MEWTAFADEISKLLGIKGNPIAITYSMTLPATSDGRKHRVCDAFLRVRDGKIIDLTSSTSTCTGGTSSLGLCERPKGEGDKALKEFLVNGEKLYGGMHLTEPPTSCGIIARYYKSS